MAMVRRERWNAFLPWPQVLHAQCLVQAGRWDEASEEAEHAFALACELGDPCWEGMAARVLGMLAVHAGDLGAAQVWLADARRRCDRVPDRYVWVSAYVGLAQLETAARQDPGLVAPAAGASSPAPADRRAVVIVRAMTRIPYVRREELGPEGQQLWDGIVASVGGEVVTADGGLAGPFNAFVTVPGAGRRLSALGAKLRFGTSIERRLSEIAIITTGARWQAEFEWWAHAAMAREHGVAGAVVDAIGRGEDPPFEADDERAVYAAARQLASSGRLDQEAYEAAHGFLGDAGMVELVSLCGYYTLISFLLNAFAVPLPPGAAPMWDSP